LLCFEAGKLCSLTVGGMCSAENNETLPFQTASRLIKCTKFLLLTELRIAYTAC